MLSIIIDLNHYVFHEKFDTWQEAIIASCQPLVKDGSIDERYHEQIIDCIEEYGPYIVLAPMVAMPHSQQNAEGVFKTSVSLMIVREPVQFDKDDREKDAKIFFTIASENNEKHLENLMQLSDMLTNQDLIDDLLNTQDIDQLREVAKKYSI
ncbi:MAG: PTS sugar transporter subunit IIA [Tissierellia bacterium]|nr:PTS sugar transporter subunit IIA [Tissierellia bacterium]